MYLLKKRGIVDWNSWKTPRSFTFHYIESWTLCCLSNLNKRLHTRCMVTARTKDQILLMNIPGTISNFLHSELRPLYIFGDSGPSFQIREPAMSRPAWTTSIRGTLTNVWRNTQRRSVCDEPPGRVPAEFLQWLKYKKVWYLLHNYCTTVQKSLTSWCFET